MYEYYAMQILKTKKKKNKKNKKKTKKQNKTKIKEQWSQREKQ